MQPRPIGSYPNIDLTFAFRVPRFDRWETRAANLLQQFVEGGTQLSSTTNEFHDGRLTRKRDALFVAHGGIEHALQFVQRKCIWHR